MKISKEAQSAAVAIGHYCEGSFQRQGEVYPCDVEWFAEKVQLAIDATVKPDAAGQYLDGVAANKILDREGIPTSGPDGALSLADRVTILVERVQSAARMREAIIAELADVRAKAEKEIAEWRDACSHAEMGDEIERLNREKAVIVQGYSKEINALYDILEEIRTAADCSSRLAVVPEIKRLKHVERQNESLLQAASAAEEHLERIERAVAKAPCVTEELRGKLSVLGQVELVVMTLGEQADEIGLLKRGNESLHEAFERTNILAQDRLQDAISADDKVRKLEALLAAKNKALAELANGLGRDSNCRAFLNGEYRHPAGFARQAMEQTEVKP